MLALVSREASRKKIGRGLRLRGRPRILKHLRITNEMEFGVSALKQRQAKNQSTFGFSVEEVKPHVSRNRPEMDPTIKC